jgi:hypothetical protein
MIAKFRIELLGSFYTFELYDSRGREIFTLDEAIEAAEEQYPNEWQSVFNGEEAVENPALTELPSGEDAIYSLDLSPHQFDDEQPRSLERFHLDDDTGPEQPYLGEM